MATGQEEQKEEQKEGQKALKEEGLEGEGQDKYTELKYYGKNALKVLFLLLCLFAAYIISSGITQLELSKLEVKKKDDVFEFPKSVKGKPLTIYRFVGQRQDEDREFRIKLEERQILLLVSLYLGYAEGDEELGEELIKREIELWDKIHYILSTKSYADMSTAKRREEYLKAELINGINGLLTQGKIEDIYFGRFFIGKLPQ